MSNDKAPIDYRSSYVPRARNCATHDRLVLDVLDGSPLVGRITSDFFRNI